VPTQTASPAPVLEATPAPVSTPAAETPVPTPEPTPAVFTLSFVGDITPDTVAAFRGSANAYQNVVKADDPGYVFAKTADYFAGDDFTMANFECVLSDGDLTAEAKNFTFKAPTAYTGLLTAGGVDFVTLGNNHVLDYGKQGYADTKAALDGAGVGYAGRDEGTLYVTESGLKIGVYAVSFGTPQQITAGVKALREQGAEFIIAALHWGDEGSYDINADQTAQGHAAIDAGADVVYGSHPHTLQPIEQYNGHYIFYSMGNWSFGGNTDPRDKDTVIAKLTVERAADGTLSVTGLELTPCASSGVKSGNNYQPVPYEKDGEDYTRTLSKLDGSFTGANLTIGYTYGPGELAND
jgi:poly-gamma-glutamate capsule biosynthesis protein CapA/YwtB (metallophosphatase superfamily)